MDGKGRGAQTTRTRLWGLCRHHGWQHTSRRRNEGHREKTVSVRPRENAAVTQTTRARTAGGPRWTERAHTRSHAHALARTHMILRLQRRKILHKHDQDARTTEENENQEL